MSTKKNHEIQSGRARLGFPDAVREAFAFLEDYGFVEVGSSSTIVRYRKGPLDLNVYHGRRSYEIGIDVGHGDDRLSMEQIIRATDPVAWKGYRAYAATTPNGVTAGVTLLAGLLHRYGERVLLDDPEFFANIRGLQGAWREEFALDVLVGQVRPKAEAAFRKGRYREAAELYGKIAERLSPAEQAKLAAARKRS